MCAGLLVSCFIFAVWYHCKEVPKFPFGLVVVPCRQEAAGCWLPAMSAAVGNTGKHHQRGCCELG